MVITMPFIGKIYDSVKTRYVVAFEMLLVLIEAKFKLGQNRSVADQRSMANALRRAGKVELADLIEPHL